MTTTVTRRTVAAATAATSHSHVTAEKKPAHHPSKPTDSFSSSGSTFNPFDPFGIGKAWANQVAVAAQGGVFGSPVLGYPTGGILGY